jgi:hypothetical protein
MQKLPVIYLFLVLSCVAVNDQNAHKTDPLHLQLISSNGVGPSWIHWESPVIPNADLVYVDNEHWEIIAINEEGGQKQCVTCKNENPLDLVFPPDEDGSFAHRHWKGDPEAHPMLPIIFFKAENEHSSHRVLRNAPSIGWDNDLWALHLEDKKYFRLTNLAAGEGLQHSAMSTDGTWYVYPHRYDIGNPPADFGLTRMVFNHIIVEDGNIGLIRQFEIQPLGAMYYEPFDIWQSGPATYSLTYAAGDGNILDPYRFDWTFSDGQIVDSLNTRLQNTPELHEEFMMVAPGGQRMVWMRGPAAGLKYKADLYISDLQFTDPKKLTWFNDCAVWPAACSPYGAQLSRLTWKDDASAVFFGVWSHGPLVPAKRAALYRLTIPD